MDSAAETGDAVDQARLKHLTENFNNLQGLSTVALGVGLAVEMMVSVYWKGSHWSLLGLLPIVGAFAATLTCIPRYYANRFGCVQQHQSQLGDLLNKQIVIIVVGFPVLWIAIDVLRSFIPAAHSIDAANLALSLVSLYIGVRMLRQTVRTLVFSGVLGFPALVPLWPRLDDHQLFTWKVINAGAMGVALVVVGLWDHVTLMRLLPKKISEDDNE